MSKPQAWALAAVLAVVSGLIRLFADAAVPPHLTWWLTAATAVIASFITSLIWISVVTKR